MREHSCAFTGHRPNGFPWGYNEKDRRCTALQAALFQQIAGLAEYGVTDFLSGMAEGVDTWAALAVLRLRTDYPLVKLHCILPCRNQERNWSDAAKDRYRSILKEADSITYVSRDYNSACMLKRNRFLVDHADLLLAVCNDPGAPREGSAATLRYAQKQGRGVILLDPLALSISCERFAPEL